MTGAGATGLLVASAQVLLLQRSSRAFPSSPHHPIESAELLWRGQEPELLTLDFSEERPPKERAFLPVLLFSKAASEFLCPGCPTAGKGDKLSLSLSPNLETSSHQLPPLTTRIQTRSLLPELGAGDISRKTQVRDWTERLPTRAAT